MWNVHWLCISFHGFYWRILIFYYRGKLCAIKYNWTHKNECDDKKLWFKSQHFGELSLTHMNILPHAAISQGCFCFKKVVIFSLCSRFKDMHSHHSSGRRGREGAIEKQGNRDIFFPLFLIIKHLIGPWVRCLCSKKKKKVACFLVVVHSELLLFFWVRRTRQNAICLDGMFLKKQQQHICCGLLLV